MPSDNFDRANSDSLGADWVEEAGDIDILSNKARATLIHSVARWDGGGDKQDKPTGAEVDIHSDSTTEDQYRNGVFIFHSGTGYSTMYFVKHRKTGTTKVDVFRWSGGTKNRLGQVDIGTKVSPGTLRLEISGNTLEIFYNGVSKGTFTDSNLTSGTSGIATRRLNGTASSVDNFLVDAVAGGSLPPLKSPGPMQALLAR